MACSLPPWVRLPSSSFCGMSIALGWPGSSSALPRIDQCAKSEVADSWGFPKMTVGQPSVNTQYRSSIVPVNSPSKILCKGINRTGISYNSSEIILAKCQIAVEHSPSARTGMRGRLESMNLSRSSLSETGVRRLPVLTCTPARFGRRRLSPLPTSRTCCRRGP